VHTKNKYQLQNKVRRMFTFSAVLVINISVSGFIATGAVYIPDTKRVYLFEIKMRCWLRNSPCTIIFFIPYCIKSNFQKRLQLFG
jgi:hypothetical protein